MNNFDLQSFELECFSEVFCDELDKKVSQTVISTTKTSEIIEKRGWRANLPTSNGIIKNKEFSYEVLITLLLESKWNQSQKEQHRFVYQNDIIISELAKQAGVSENTFRKGLNNLIKLGYVKATTHNNEKVYKIPQKYTEGNLLFDVDFLDDLLGLVHKNLIKVYLQYYKYCYKNNNTGVYKKSQADTLDAIGLNSKSEKNKSYLRKINRLLVKLGLIEIQEVKHINGRVLQIRCPHYKETSFYKEVLYPEISL